MVVFVQVLRSFDPCLLEYLVEERLVVGDELVDVCVELESISMVKDFECVVVAVTASRDQLLVIYVVAVLHFHLYLATTLVQ